MLTFEHLKAVARKGAPSSNIQSIIAGLEYGGSAAGLILPHRYVHYGAQVAHESGGFYYDEEVWGPTPAQKRYEDRADLGHSTAVDGEAYSFRGRSGIQITGRANYREFTAWCRAQGFDCPDFEKYPDAITMDPWEGLVPIWYWSTRKLNRYADTNDIEMVTRRINGGLNGFSDRLDRYNDLSLVVLGYAPNEAGLKDFQRAAQKQGLLPPDTKDSTQVDGIPGPKTRAAQHMTLVELGKQQKPTLAVPEGEPMPETKPSPVTEDRAVPVPVAPANADKTATNRWASVIGVTAPVVAAFGGLDNTGKVLVVAMGVAAVLVVLWRGELIARRVRALRRAFE